MSDGKGETLHCRNAELGAVLTHTPGARNRDEILEQFTHPSRGSRDSVQANRGRSSAETSQSQGARARNLEGRAKVGAVATESGHALGRLQTPFPATLQVDGQERFSKLVEFLRKKLGKDQVVSPGAKTDPLCDVAEFGGNIAESRERCAASPAAPTSTGFRSPISSTVPVPEGGILSFSGGAHLRPVRSFRCGRPPRGELRLHTGLGLAAEGRG